MKIGIDFSINSTALAVENVHGDVKLFSFISNYKRGSRKFKIHDDLSDIITVEGYEKYSGSDDEQTEKLHNADTLSNLIVSKLQQDEIPKEIRIEGYSYGSKGNAFIDLITFNTFLKVKLIQKYGHVIKVIPPKTLKKKFTGNGNATKCDMIRYFMKNSSSLFHTLKDKINELDFIKEDSEFTIPKPIDDIIDAIALISIE